MSIASTTKSVSVKSDIPYGKLAAQRLDLYVPVQTTSDPNRATTPLVCFVHGGAWRSEDKTDHAQLAIRLAQRTGCCVAVPNYRLTAREPTPETALQHPAHAEDVLAALEFLVHPSPTAISSSSSGLYLDPQAPPYRSDEIYAIGHSCGAHILTSIFLDSSKYTPSLTPSQGLLSAIAGIALSEGIYDIDLLLTSFPTYKDWFIVNTFGSKSEYACESTTRYPRRANDGDLVWLIVHSPADTLVDLAQSRAIYDHLNSLNFDVRKEWERLTIEHNDMLKTSEYSDLMGDFINGLINRKLSK